MGPGIRFTTVIWHTRGPNALVFSPPCWRRVAGCVWRQLPWLGRRQQRAPAALLRDNQEPVNFRDGTDNAVTNTPPLKLLPAPNAAAAFVITGGCLNCCARLGIAAREEMSVHPPAHFGAESRLVAARRSPPQWTEWDDTRLATVLVHAPFDAYGTIRAMCRRFNALLRSPTFRKARLGSRYAEHRAIIVGEDGCFVLHRGW